jgi:DNA mismatch endonuclease (patch repair protein)
MADVFTKRKRSEVMSQIRSRGNRATEMRLASLMRKVGIRGWRRHLRITGRPDFAFKGQKIAIFVDGCFWHQCPKCSNIPKNNAACWNTKLTANQTRDRRVNRELRLQGWRVLRIWEHDLEKAPERILKRLRTALSK